MQFLRKEFKVENDDWFGVGEVIEFEIAFGYGSKFDTEIWVFDIL